MSSTEDRRQRRRWPEADAEASSAEGEGFVVLVISKQVHAKGNVIAILTFGSILLSLQFLLLTDDELNMCSYGLLMGPFNIQIHIKEKWDSRSYICKKDKKNSIFFSFVSCLIKGNVIAISIY